MAKNTPKELKENTVLLDLVNKAVQEIPENQISKVSDGYHTFQELYDHRVTLFVALCNTIVSGSITLGEDGYPWKSKLHSDGTMWDGWFIAGIGQESGKTLTYHLPMSEWDNLRSQPIEKAPEWDGHTSEDVLRLLKEI